MKSLRLFAFDPVNVELSYEDVQGDPTQFWGHGRKYFLVLSDKRGREKKILAADLSETGGGMRLERWEVNRQGTKSVLSVYFEINILGHSLNQWLHYDLRNGEMLKGFKGLAQLAEERQRELAEARKRDQRPRVVVNARGEEKRVG